jgi:TRAP-type C4-dicarboxylate transport system substrate-binding protein
MTFSRKFIIAVLFALAPVTARAETVIKFATLAPEGSTWMRVMKEFQTAVETQTAGRVKFKTYPGGVQGDENDVLRKIRLGQLHGGGFTGVGIGQVAPSLRVLDAPFLFHSSDEIDHITKTYDAQFRKSLADGGYVLLGWADVGFVYLMSNTPIRAPQDLHHVKMWIWEGDPVAEAAFKYMQVSPVPLSVTDVLTSLQTGLIDGVYGSPLAIVAMQWYSKMKYMFGLPITNASGAALVSKKAFDQLSPQDQKTLLDLGQKYFTEKLSTLSRQDNTTSIATLKKEKIVVTDPASKDAAAQFENMGIQSRKSLCGKMYSAELLSGIEKTLADYRAAKDKKKPAHAK